MILDDIMETFDDTRARATLQLCAEIGTNGQAVLFTHHAHLVELARDSIKGVTVVNMPDLLFSVGAGFAFAHRRADGGSVFP